jgi:hypothetical protein
MKKLLMTALFLAMTTSAFAAARVDTQTTEDAKEAARQANYDKYANDHPKTEAVSQPGLKIAINTDRIIRSCCRPPDLVVSGHVTNVAQRPLNYVHFVFAFEDEDGKVIHAESVYNHKAESLSDDAEMEQILKEKPHFTPIKPGDTDTFVMDVPLPLLPKFDKVEMFSNDTRP